jgi:galactose-1-phosphate uridylyltransferase
MEFVRIPRLTRFLDPRQDYAETTIESEIRIDPLTQFSGRIAHFAVGPRPEMDLEALSQASLAHGCPFCPEMVTRVTPKFIPEIAPDGRFSKGEAIVFPNLSPYDAHSAVTVVTKAHLVRTSEFTIAHWQDALIASVNYFRAVHHAEQHIGYGLIAGNYMPMAGASLLHPHLQIYATDRPGNFLKAQIDAARHYHQTTGELFWKQFLRSEQESGVRYLGNTGSVEWIVPFVPLSFIGDVEALFPDRYSILDLTVADLHDFAQGLDRILQYMTDTHIYSFNIAFYPGQSLEDRTWVHARISFRGMINPVLNSPDVSAIRQLYDEPFTTIFPEEVAAELKPYFTER